MSVTIAIYINYEDSLTYSSHESKSQFDNDGEFTRQTTGIRHLPPVCYNGWYMKQERPVYHERIVTDPRILKGKPVVQGTRIAVDLVLEELSHNPDVNELLAAHPALTRDDVQACLAYAKDILTGQEVSPKPPKGHRPASL